MATNAVDIQGTFGAVLLGGFLASLLTGAVWLQTIIYFKVYHSDSRIVKFLVFTIWILDTLHSCFIWVSNWIYLIRDYGDSSKIDTIPWSIATSIVSTAILTFLVHCFFAHRIFLLSRKSWFLTAPILTLAVSRLISASVTTAQMVRLDTFSRFKDDYSWVFTLGLSLSSVVDILITGSLFHLLRASRSSNGAESLNAIIDALILYTFETGTLTCVGTVIALMCWLSMSSNLIFLGIHFVIGKLYANSILVTLNTRQSIREGRPSTGGDPFLVMDLPQTPCRFEISHTVSGGGESNLTKAADLQVNVERSVQYTRDYNDGPKVYISAEP